MTLAEALTALIMAVLAALLLTGIQRAHLSARHRLLQGAYGGRHRPHRPFGRAFAFNLVSVGVILAITLATTHFIRSN